MNIKFTRPQRMIFLGCFIAYFGAYIGRLNASAALPGISQALNLTGEQSGLLQTVFALTYAVGQLVNGAIVDRINPRKFIFTGLLGSAAANLAFGLSNSYGMLLAAWCVNGAAQSMLWTPIVRMVADSFDAERRQRASFLLSMTCVLGHLAAWAIAGVLATYFSWKLSFLLPAGVLLAVSFITQPMLRYEREAQLVQRQGEATARAAQMPILQMLFSTGLWMMLLCCVCNGFVRDGAITWSPTILSEISQTSISSVAVSLIIPMANLLGIAIGRMMFKRAKGNARVSVGWMMLAGSGVALLLWALGMKQMLSCALLLGMLCAVMQGLNPLLVSLLPMEYDSAGRVGMVAGLVDCCIYIGSSLAGVLTGALKDASGWNVVFIAWMAVAIAGSALGMLSGKQSKRAKATKMP